MFRSTQAARPSAVDVAVRVSLVGLAVATAYIHSTLGGLMFLANALGFATLAVAMIAPVGLAVRFRGLIQVALGGFAAATIVGWALFGARYSTAYVATGIEVAIVALVAIATYRAYGSPVAIVRSLVARIGGPSDASATA
ncbi:MAG: hypothetical protein M3P84_12870 [Chloroflexota bacterium]|nr:hypothetical protein [Chloroflexota bacterium]